MRDFERRGGRLRALPLETRVLYTGYLLTVCAALIVSTMLYSAGPGTRGNEAADYYAGQTENEERGTHSPAASLSNDEGTAASGPLLDLGGLGGISDASASDTPIQPRINRKRLLETTHGHLWMMPLVLLVVAHLYLLVGHPRRTAFGLIAIASIATVAHIIAPWLVRDVSRSLVWLLAVSGIMLLTSMALMIAATLWAMWRPNSTRRPTPS